MHNKIIFSLDIGSSKIVAVAGSIEDTIKIHGVSSTYFVNSTKANEFLDVTNGVICNLETVAAKSAQVLNEARINADCSVGGVVLNIAGNGVYSHYVKNTIKLEGGEITSTTMRELIKDVSQISVSPRHTVLDYEVQEYVLDDENYATNPIHLIADKIESNLNVFLGSSSQIANLKKIVEHTCFDLAKLVPSGVLSGMAVLNYEEKDLGCCLLDIGLGTTDLVVYENGFIRYLCSIPIGGEAITRDIASVLKISRNLAEDIKLNYGNCSYSSVSNSGAKLLDSIAFTDHRGISITISRKLLIDVINERLKDIFDVVKSTLIKREIYDIIGSGFVITGGVSALPNIDELARNYFKLPVKVGIPGYSGEFADVVANPRYATSLGGLYFASRYIMDDLNSISFKLNKFKSLVSGLKRLLGLNIRHKT